MHLIKSKIILDNTQNIIVAYKIGQTTRTIAKRYGLSAETIRKILVANSVQRRQRNINPLLCHKKCTICKRTFPNTSEYFNNKGRAYADGTPKLRSYCKSCNVSYYTKYARKRKAVDVNFKLRKGLSSRIRRALAYTNNRKKAYRTEILLGCSIVHFKKHMEQQFSDGMNWENYGKGGWNIDHIIPCAAFDLSRTEDQLLCFNYKNLQPLWEDDNFKKNSFYNGKRISK